MGQLIIIFLIILCIYLYFNSNSSENFEDSTLEQNDPVFDNAKFYLLDLNTSDDITGFAKCIQECEGVCVEYGITGSAWCIPNSNDAPPLEDDGVPRSIPSTTF